MGSLKVTLCAGAALFAALTPAAHAADGGTVSVTPASPAPGADVSLRISGCVGTTGSAASDAFVTDARLTGRAGTLAGGTRVRSTLEPGPHDVRITCGSLTVKGSITVASNASRSPAERPTAPASPVAPVHAGGGGSAPLAAADARAAGPGTAQTVTGLVLAGVAAAAVAARGARRSRKAD